ncbi:MAG: cyclic peptide export ABC transporter [Nitrosomonas sp.]
MTAARFTSMDIIVHLLLRSRINIVVGVLTGIVSGLGSAALIGLINTEVHSTASDFGYTPLIFCGLGFLVLLTHVASTIIVMRVGQTVARDLRMELSRRIISAPLRLLQQLGAPRLMANLTEDIGVLVDAFQMIPHMCINVSWVFGCLIYLCWLSWQLFMLVAAIIVIGIIIYRLSTAKAIKPLRAAREQDDALYGHFRSLIQGIKEIKLHRQRQNAFLMDLLYPTAEACRQGNMSAMTVFTIAAALGTATLYFLIGIILFEASAWGDINQEIVSGYTLTVLYMMAPLTGVVSGLPTLGRASIALAKINHLKKELTEQAENAGEQTSITQPAYSGLLEFIEVTHRYKREGDERDFTLGPLNLTLKPGEVIFITGGNGSGKSTFGLLLVGLYSPEGGQIRLNKEIINDMNREFYRQQFSVVFSDFYLFENLLGLLNDNLDSKAKAYLAKLKLDHKVTVEDGVFSTIELSQGQRKRLALITAYLEDRPFYVFDEWAADQDPLFKELFYTTILADLKARGKTVVVITHDDHFFHLADRCIRLEDGRIVESAQARQKSILPIHKAKNDLSLQEINLR